MEAERGRHGGKVVWHCIRDIQCGRRGLVPIPKKGGLGSCDNWRGICLLDVVVVRVLQESLQKLAEDELPESQCGF